MDVKTIRPDSMLCEFDKPSEKMRREQKCVGYFQVVVRKLFLENTNHFKSHHFGVLFIWHFELL